MDILRDDARDAAAVLLLAHGSGAPMDSAFMQRMATLIAQRGVTVLRFEFSYMAARRAGGARRPPPRAEALVAEYCEAVAAAAGDAPLLIGGKSLGGRVASLVAGWLHEEGRIVGLVCLGFPFHPPGQPDRLRIVSLCRTTVPTLICQGERDPFGSRTEVEGYSLPQQVRFFWAIDGNHDLVPRRKSGRTAEDNWMAAADAVASFAGQLVA